MGRQLAVGVGVATGTALLVVGVASAGLVGLRSGAPGAAVAVASVTPTTRATPTVSARPAGPVPTRGADQVLAEVTIDPAALPVGGVDNAAVVVVVQDDAVAVHHIALDATTGEWARLDPATVGSSLLEISPDGRSASRRAVGPAGDVVDEIVDLATGTVRAAPVIVPSGQDPDYCYTWPVAWAPNGGRAATVTRCSQPPLEPAQTGQQGTWLHEVDLATGAARLLEDVPGASTSAPGPSYSPDGRFLAYVVEVPSGAGGVRMVLRIVALDGSATRTLDAVHPVHGDPWLSAAALVAWDATSGVDVVVDAASGTTSPLGLAHTMEHVGAVGGRIVLTTVGGPMACGAAACVVDPVTAESDPWMTLPGHGQVLAVLPARAVVQP